MWPYKICEFSQPSSSYDATLCVAIFFLIVVWLVLVRMLHLIHSQLGTSCAQTNLPVNLSIMSLPGPGQVCSQPSFHSNPRQLPEAAKIASVWFRSMWICSWSTTGPFFLDWEHSHATLHSALHKQSQRWTIFRHQGVCQFANRCCRKQPYKTMSLWVWVASSWIRIISCQGSSWLDDHEWLWVGSKTKSSYLNSVEAISQRYYTQHDSYLLGGRIVRASWPGPFNALYSALLTFSTVLGKESRGISVYISPNPTSSQVLNTNTNFPVVLSNVLIRPL